MSDPKRNLPSWMSSKDNNQTKFHGKKPPSSRKDQENNQLEDNSGFHKLLEGVVFVLSGFVNPERATLRSQVLEMGAEYRPDWTSDCTLLVCAYTNTPKFRQVEADCGTIVKKEWILECYNQKKLVEIDSYLMHAGRPWRKNNISSEMKSDEKKKTSPSNKSEQHVERSLSKSTAASSSSKKSRQSNSTKELFSSSKVKEWVVDDLNRTISWLESQEEKPEPSEIKQIAAEGILICFQDAIDAVEQSQDVRQVAEQWNVIPRAVEELAKLVDTAKGDASLTKEDLCRHAKACKQMYEAELCSLQDDSQSKTKRVKTGESTRSGKGKGKYDGNETVELTEKGGYDSDETIEMTQEEIDLAYSTLSAE